jgi:hypothetical protein
MSAAAADRLLADAALAFGESNPIGAARTLARAIRRQTAGAKLAVVGALIRELEAGERGITRDVLADLRR